MIKKIKQGSIIKVNLNPTKGHEQAGYRPVVVISNEQYMKYTNLVQVCPISNSDNDFPLHIPLDQQTKTTGYILCEHIKTLDINARGYQYCEELPNEILKQVIDYVKACY